MRRNEGQGKAWSKPGDSQMLRLISEGHPNGIRRVSEGIRRVSGGYSLGSIGRSWPLPNPDGGVAEVLPHLTTPRQSRSL